MDARKSPSCCEAPGAEDENTQATNPRVTALLLRYAEDGLLPVSAQLARTLECCPDCLLRRAQDGEACNVVAGTDHNHNCGVERSAYAACTGLGPLYGFGAVLPLSRTATDEEAPLGPADLDLLFHFAGKTWCVFFGGAHVRCLYTAEDVTHWLYAGMPQESSTSCCIPWTWVASWCAQQYNNLS